MILFTDKCYTLYTYSEPPLTTKQFLGLINRNSTLPDLTVGTSKTIFTLYCCTASAITLLRLDSVFSAILPGNCAARSSEGYTRNICPIPSVCTRRKKECLIRLVNPVTIYIFFHVLLVVGQIKTHYLRSSPNNPPDFSTS